MKKDKGFTLIELLVVIAIIAFLSSIALAALNSARASANNTKFALEMKSLTSALALYRLKNGSIPLQDQGSDNVGTAADDGDTSLDTALSALVTDKDIAKIPHYTGWVSGGAVPAYILYLTNNTNGALGTPYNYNCGVKPATFPYVADQTNLGVIEIITSAANLGLKLPKQDVWMVYSNGTTGYYDQNSPSNDVYCLPLGI